jgi:hypothetical protein
MLIPGVMFAWICVKAVAPGGTDPPCAGLWRPGRPLSWSFTTLAVAAKNVVASGPDYLVRETAFTVQWLVVAPLTLLCVAVVAPRGWSHRGGGLIRAALFATVNRSASARITSIDAVALSVDIGSD